MIANKIDETMKQKLCACRNEFNNNSNLHKAVNTILTLSIEIAIRSRISSGVLLLSAIKNPMLTIITSRISRIRSMITASATKLTTRTRTLNIAIKATKATTSTVKTKIDPQTPTFCRRRTSYKLPPIPELLRQ